MSFTLPTLAGDLTACCSPVTSGNLDDGAAQRLAQVFKALGDPTRVKLLSLIAAHPGGEACVCDLIEPVGLAQPTVSHHLKLLVDAGLITREQRGRWSYHRIVQPALDALADSLRAPTSDGALTRVAVCASSSPERAASSAPASPLP